MSAKIQQKYWGILLLFIVAGFGAWLYINQSPFVWYWVFGLCFGAILQRSRLCFVSATSEPLITGSTAQLRAILVGVLVASFGVTVQKYLSNGTLDMLGVSTISLPLLIGAFLFGVGMILAGGCASSMFVRFAEGYAIHIFTIAFTLFGYVFATSHYQKFWAPFIVDAPVIFLPEELGWELGVGMHIITIVLLYLVALRHEQGNSSSYTGSYLAGAVLLGIATILHYYVMESGFSVTGAFFYFGRISEIMSSDSMLASAIGPTLRNFGLFAGAFVSALLFGGFRFKKIRSFKQIILNCIGGCLMGYGAAIAGGCNISAFFNAAACMSLSAWCFIICLFIGSMVGTKLLYKLL